MGTSFHFIADPSAPNEVSQWFASLNTPPEAIPTAFGSWLYFRDLGPLTHNPDGSIVREKSPLVSLVLPREHRGVFWTVGEVHFWPSPMRAQFPKLQKVQKTFSMWLSAQQAIFSSKDQPGNYDYYLEGTVRSFASTVFAFESGLSAIKSERYFITDNDAKGTLDQLCKKLRLRGVNCAPV